MIARISIILITLLILPAWYIDKTRLRKRTHWVRILFWTPNLLLLLTTAFFSFSKQFSFENADMTGLYLFLLLCVSVPETIYMLCALCGKLYKRRQKWFNGIGIIAGLVVLGILISGYMLGSKRLVVKNYTHTSAALPKGFNGYRIAQFSDLHLGTYHNNPAVVRHFVDKINQLRPDLIVFTGDLVNFQSNELTPFISILSQLRAPDGVISILGNHDYMNYMKWPTEAMRTADIQQLVYMQKRMGWKPLLNEHIVLRRGTDSISIVGVENDGKPPFPQRGDLTKAQKGLDEKCFKVLLSHDPTHWRRRVLPETKIQLMLAGHTHGMQFKIGNFSPASWFYPEWGGSYRENYQELIVSLGMGEVLMPFRFGAWPEIDVITLQNKQ